MKFIEDVVPYFIIFIVVVIIRMFIVTPVIVSGSSMESTLEDGEILLLKKYDKTYDRNDIIVFDYDNTKLVKRIIGLPGETVEYKNKKLYINGKELEDDFAIFTQDFKLSKLGYTIIPDNYFFVLGDNRNNSSDSRQIGLVAKEDINGTTNFSIWPIKFIK